ncbi:hypothetical protein KPL71_022235 [Citrus sinensis]|uniref:Uncharacterized protein n=1 Tax=Citrus sinensis TaxID=2711 RepID=A0ACB8JLE8_CITSI|nr:hypothetical protein KPL71_022235 [Citrus sinensis]
MGHTAAECWHRFKKNFVPEPNRRRETRGAYVALTDRQSSGAWYLDNGATNHVKNALGNININSEYQSNDQLVVGNGEKLVISHIGCSVLPIFDPQKHITLNHILHVPDITKNVISISKLLHDNDINVEFHKSACFVKDKKQGKILMKGVARDGSSKNLHTAFLSVSSIPVSIRSISDPLSMLSFNSNGVDFKETFSPVVKAATIRIVLTLAVNNNWMLRQVDINNAFLNGDLTEEVYMPQHEGFENKSKPNYICKLNKALYGLKQAPRVCTSEKLKRNEGAKFHDPTLYRSVIGSLQYAVLTRPKLAFSVNKLSQFMSDPRHSHCITCKRVLRYLKNTMNMCLRIKKSEYFDLTAYTNADWASDPDDRRSINGYCVYLGNNLVAWSSRKQGVVARSIAESEYRAMAVCSVEITWISSLLNELELKVQGTLVILSDSTSAAAITANPIYHSRTKHFEIDLHFIRDKVMKGEIKISFVASKDQTADVLTKPLLYYKFDYFRSKLNVFARPCV